MAVALAGVGYGVLLDFIGDAACPTPGRDSQWGRLSWSVLPPGPKCTWTEPLHGIDRVDGPGSVMSLWLVGLGLLAVGLVRWHRRAFPLR